tara:strand:+ start:1351 stop:1617 length:267 start_codon:yes stop_codon:yes gene_type:complete
MSYYVPKKNRCCDGPCISPFKLTFAVSSSLNTSVTSSKSEYKTYEDNKNVSSNIVGKGVGNTRKQGSGGNSYDSYLARLKGNKYCNNC